MRGAHHPHPCVHRKGTAGHSRTADRSARTAELSECYFFDSIAQLLAAGAEISMPYLFDTLPLTQDAA